MGTDVTHVLNNIQIVMINTTLPANIGSAARAMHTMGLTNLTVVAPKLPIDDSSISHAAGAQNILANTQVVDSLSDALHASTLTFAASSRSRTMPRPVVNPTQAAQIMYEFLQKNAYATPTDNIAPVDDELTQPQQISILFGREDRGLTNEELALADYHIQIDANPAYPVLNVASAVQVIASFIYAYVCQQEQAVKAECTNSDLASHMISPKNSAELVHMIRQEWDEPAITHTEAQLLNSRLIDVMVDLELANADDLRLLPQRLSRLTSRLQLDKKEYQLINAVLGTLQKRQNNR